MEQEGIWWKAVYCGLPAMEIVFMGYCLYRLVAPFMGRGGLEGGNLRSWMAFERMSPAAYRKVRKPKKAAVWTGVAYVCVMLGIYVISLCMEGVPLRRSMGALAVFLVMCRTDRRNYGQKVFLVQTFFSLHRFAGAVAEMMYDNLYSIIENTDYMAAHPDMSLSLYAAVCASYLLVELLFMGISIGCILRTYVYRYAVMSIKELLVLMTPLFLGTAGYWVIGHYRNFYVGEVQRSPDFFDMLSLFYYIVAMITIVAFIALYQSIKAGQEEKQRSELLALQMEDIRQHIEQVENLYQDIRGIRHDMANHIATLERLYAVDKAEEALIYSRQLKDALSQRLGQMNSGNPVTDIILLETKKEAEQRGLEFRTDFYYPTGSRINAFDVSVILNNALQNALENVSENAAGKAACISVRSYCRNNAYMIEICNSFTGNLQWDIWSGLPLTSKEKAADSNDYRTAHGYGLSNIRRVAGKYSGDIAIDLQDGEFRLSVMLMMK